jgi:hypothetical protein
MEETYDCLHCGHCLRIRTKLVSVEKGEATLNILKNRRIKALQSGKKPREGNWDRRAVKDKKFKLSKAKLNIKEDHRPSPQIPIKAHGEAY